MPAYFSVNSWTWHMQGVGHKLFMENWQNNATLKENSPNFVTKRTFRFFQRDTTFLLEILGEAVECCSCGWSWHELSWRCNKREMLAIACSKPRAELQAHRQHITWKAGCVRSLPTIACIITCIFTIILLIMIIIIVIMISTLSGVILWCA